jgi:hypothetical protein
MDQETVMVNKFGLMEMCMMVYLNIYIYIIFAKIYIKIH